MAALGKENPAVVSGAVPRGTLSGQRVPTSNPFFSGRPVPGQGLYTGEGPSVRRAAALWRSAPHGGAHLLRFSTSSGSSSGAPLCIWERQVSVRREVCRRTWRAVPAMSGGPPARGQALVFAVQYKFRKSVREPLCAFGRDRYPSAGRYAGEHGEPFRR